MDDKTELQKKALAFAESRERAGCAYFNGLYTGFIAGYQACEGKDTTDEPQTSNCIKPAVNACFTSREQLRTFIQMHIPMAVKPTKPAKTMLVSAFRSANAENIVIDMLTDAFLNRR
jgi:hypothetical protein